jgi:hypothetical protein
VYWMRINLFFLFFDLESSFNLGDFELKLAFFHLRLNLLVFRLALVL